MDISTIFGTGLSTIFGGAFGGLLRLAPEVMKLLDAKNERSHELAMQDKALEFEKLRGEQKISEIETEQSGQVFLAQMNAITEATKAQGQLTGVKWVDALNSFVRPGVTYYLFGLYGLFKTGMLIIAIQSEGPLIALSKSWSGEDQAMLSVILSFWFVSRSIDKRK